MKFNRILSTVIIFVMLFMSMVSVFPVSALAAESGDKKVQVTNVKDPITDTDAIAGIVDEYLKYNFKTAEEMLNYELSKNYLASAKTDNYTVYVNVYTGFVYYVNNVTGQIITSNPTDPAYQTKEGADTIVSLESKVMSQLELAYNTIGSSGEDTVYDSITWIKSGSILAVSVIDDKGLAVTYTLGEASASFISPEVLLADTFMENIANPMFATFAALLEKHCGAFDASKATAGLKSYLITENDVTKASGQLSPGRIDSVVKALKSYAETVINSKNSPEYNEITTYAAYISTIFTSFGLIDPAEEFANVPPAWAELPAIKEGKAVYALLKNELGDLRAIDQVLRKAVPTYTLEMVSLHETACGHVAAGVNTPTFRVTINYTLDTDGILTVDIPVDPASLVFDDTVYTLSSITPLKYFGAGNMDDDGYIFYPDGSGTIVEFEDFYFGSNSGKANGNLFVDAPLYGNDFIYSEIQGAHREQVTMPIYGIVNDVAVNESTDSYTDKSKVTNGFFVVIEEGAASTTLGFMTEGASHKYASAFTKLKPYPADKLDLSQSLSVSGLGYYYVVAETGYQGSYKFRINMLADETVAETSGYSDEDSFYPSDYTGMAACYRDYLLASGEITALTEFSEDLPLYLEALGSIDITQRILTFPVTVSTALTTFEDVKNIYNELSDVTAAIAEFKAKAEEYDALAVDKEENDEKLDDNDERLIKSYRDKAEHYRQLAEKVENIYNINFKLTGFANGGMYSTYPAKVDWEGSVGGEGGFRNLVDYASGISSQKNKTFGVYPDFDFLFINNTALFDGIDPDSTAARMVDNRYASKQAYDSIQQKYESLFALLISGNSLDGLYTKFNNRYSQFNVKSLSVSTLGSTINSNMDEDNLVDRDSTLGYITSLLNRMSKADADNYSLMTDVGNIYSVKYVDHILNASIDSSHFRYSSFTVPFYGMVLHGYVNYAGSPLNYSGSPDYDILRSIESGASLYYILCCSNTNYLKEDKLLSQYYGIDYENWHEKILEQYALLNGAIGDLQSYNIVDHQILAVERIIDPDELYANYDRLAAEFVKAVDSLISKKIDKTIKDISGGEHVADIGYRIEIDTDGILALLTDLLSSYDDEEMREEIYDKYVNGYDKVDGVLDIIEEYKAGYNTAGGHLISIVANDDIKGKYTSKYSYVTDSVSTDRDNYKYTDFTCDNGSVVMVTYKGTNAEGNSDEVVFILNYNTFSVEVILDGAAEPYVLGAYGCYRIDSTGAKKIK